MWLRKLQILILLFSVVFVGCDGWSKLSFTEQQVELLFRYGPEWHSQNAIGFSLLLKNTMDSPLTGCRITINKSHEATLGELEIYPGFGQGNQKRQVSDIKNGEKVELYFHRDNNNRSIMRSANNEALSRFSPIEDIGLYCLEEQFSWQLNTPSNIR